MAINSQAMPDDDPLVLEAAEWLIRLRDKEVAPQVIAEWERWLAADPNHRRAFVQVQTLWEAMGQVEALPWPSDAEVLNDRYGAEEPVAAWREHAHSTRPAMRVIARRLANGVTRHRRRVAAAAVVLIALGAGFTWRAAHVLWPAVLEAGMTLETNTAENRRFPLPDGSTVYLGGASRVTVTLTAEHRSLSLDRGEAFFEVAKDPARPFTVRAGAAQVTAVGTAFDVRRSGDGVLVAVTHGVVKIAALDLPTLSVASAAGESQLHAGQAAEFSRAGWSVPVTASVPSMTAWRDGRLQYSSEPLRLVVAELTRYSDVPVEIADPEVADVRVTATVFESNVRGWLEGLEQALPVKVEFGKDRIVISKRDPGDRGRTE
jgi:transmembrane sensor